jgi:hypothetical protein
MEVLVSHTKLWYQSGNFRESQRSEDEHKIGDKGSVEEPQWLISYLENTESDSEINAEHTAVDIEEEATPNENHNGVISLLLPLRVKSRNESRKNGLQ